MRKLLSRLLACVAASLLAVAPATAQEAADNVVIVLDASGSMSGKLKGTDLSRMEAAKSALKEVLRQITPTTRVGLLVFSAKDLRDSWVFPLGPRDDARLNTAIDRLQPGAGTPLGEFIKYGADRLLEERKKQFGYGTYRLLVVTDGEANDQILVERYTPDVISRGIIMDVIGVGMDTRHTLATKAHSYRSANDPAALKQAIQAVFAELGAGAKDTAGEDAFAVIAPLPLEVAQAALLALATSGNEPIGARVESHAASEPASGQPTPGSPPPTPQREGISLFKLMFILFIVLMVGRGFVRAIFRGKKR